MGLPMGLRISAMPDDAGLGAVLYGPIVLAGELGSQGLTKEMIVGPEGPDVEHLPLEIPSFKAAGAAPKDWIQPAGEPLAFRTTGQARDVTLAPLNRMFDKRYSIYWRVS